MTYINMDFEGLQETIARMIAGEEIEVRTSRFANDFETFRSRDDVLTLLIHLGYLTWHKEDGTAHIPNEEVRMEVEEFPSGKGIADVVYLPKRKSMLPALVIELKWNKSSEGAIQQIKESLWRLTILATLL